MTIPREKIGDNGQRYQIKFCDGTGEHTLSYAGTSEGAARIVEAYRRNPRGWSVWIVDRQAPAAPAETYANMEARTLAAEIAWLRSALEAVVACADTAEALSIQRNAMLAAARAGLSPPR